ncbi:MAG: hypothetical protein ACLFTB_04065 [Desulfovibrionales bacterium]
MRLVRPDSTTDRIPDRIPDAITEEDERIFASVVSVDLEPWQKEQIVSPETTYPRQGRVLAAHWHPEFVPLELVSRRLEALFPNKAEELVIPTQHNELLVFGPYAGVEVDCYAGRFDQKVQLLLHFRAERVAEAGVLTSLLAHTYQYRSKQLWDFIHAVVGPDESIVSVAAKATGAGSGLVNFVRAYVKRVEELLEKHWSDVSRDSFKNKLLRNFFNGLRPVYGDSVIDRAQAFLKVVKEQVKLGFSPTYFYRVSEVIEEARSLGGCVVIPHPEQFWPILLARYDVDGYEVWNPQSRRYTDFLVDVVTEMNAKSGSGRRILVFMGDDTHMGEKVKPPALQDPAKAAREIGVQPAWDDMGLRTRLIFANMSRQAVIREYIERLSA